MGWALKVLPPVGHMSNDKTVIEAAWQALNLKTEDPIRYTQLIGTPAYQAGAAPMANLDWPVQFHSAARYLGVTPGAPTRSILVDRQDWRDTEASPPLVLECSPVDSDTDELPSLEECPPRRLPDAMPPLGPSDDEDERVPPLGFSSDVSYDDSEENDYDSDGFIGPLPRHTAAQQHVLYVCEVKDDQVFYHLTVDPTGDNDPRVQQGREDDPRIQQGLDVDMGAQRLANVDPRIQQGLDDLDVEIVQSLCQTCGFYHSPSDVHDPEPPPLLASVAARDEAIARRFILDPEVVAWVADRLDHQDDHVLTPQPVENDDAGPPVFGHGQPYIQDVD
jgi:hypothetical protein